MLLAEHLKCFPDILFHMFVPFDLIVFFYLLNYNINYCIFFILHQFGYLKLTNFNFFLIFKNIYQILFYIQIFLFQINFYFSNLNNIYIKILSSKMHEEKSRIIKEL